MSSPAPPPARTRATDLLALRLAPDSGVPLWRQLADSLRDAVRGGRVAPGTRLPSSRVLAASLSVSRNTVLNALEQLIAEGYLRTLPSSGVVVSEELVRDTPEAPAAGGGAAGHPGWSPMGEALSATPTDLMLPHTRVRPFRPNCPALDLFPVALWTRLQARLVRRLSLAEQRALLWEGDPRGHRPLREAVADYLGLARGVRCAADQVLIVSGSQQGLSLAITLLLHRGDTCWIEDPGYISARVALATNGARLVPVPVDEEGIDVAHGERTAPAARFAYVSPSKQFPLGVTMSLPRRLRLLDWAARTGAFILEDDYDSEFHYEGRQLPALQGLDEAGRVIYVGTFSKVVFPALRLGYLVLPPALVDTFVSARAALDRHSPTLDQAVLAEFIAEGHFARHISRMRKAYAARQRALVGLAASLAESMTVAPTPAGLQLVARLAPRLDADAVGAAAARRGVDAVPLGRFALRHRAPEGLLLGFAGFTEAEMADGIDRLGDALRAVRRGAA